MKQRLYWGLGSTMLLIVTLIVTLTFANFAAVLTAWGVLTNAKDALEITQGVVNVLTGEQRTLEGRTEELKAWYDENVEEYLIPAGKKLAELYAKVNRAETRVQDAQVVVNNCQSQIETASRSISYFRRRLEETVSGSEAGPLWDSLQYWRKNKTHWESELFTANTTLSVEKYTLIMYRRDHAEQRKRVISYDFATQASRRAWRRAQGVLANKVAELETKLAELAEKQAQMQTAIEGLESALADLSTRMDANEQLDANQQQQLDEMRTDLDRILEYLGLE